MREVYFSLEENEWGGWGGGRTKTFSISLVSVVQRVCGISLVSVLIAVMVRSYHYVNELSDPRRTRPVNVRRILEKVGHVALRACKKVRFQSQYLFSTCVHT